MSDVNMKIDNSRDCILGTIVISTPVTANKTTHETDGQITLVQADIVNKRQILGDRYDEVDFYSA